MTNLIRYNRNNPDGTVEHIGDVHAYPLDHGDDRLPCGVSIDVERSGGWDGTTRPVTCTGCRGYLNRWGAGNVALEDQSVIYAESIADNGPWSQCQ